MSYRAKPARVLARRSHRPAIGWSLYRHVSDADSGRMAFAADASTRDAASVRSDAARSTLEGSAAAEPRKGRGNWSAIPYGSGSGGMTARRERRLWGVTGAPAARVPPLGPPMRALQVQQREAVTPSAGQLRLRRDRAE